MKTILIVSFLLAVKVSLSQECTPTTVKTNQDRTKDKHVIDFKKFNEHKALIDTKYIGRWQKHYTALTDEIEPRAKNPASVRKSDTPEDSIYNLKGYMWFVKREGNDCDLHIEIGGKSGNGTRIIVEVPTENKKVQKKILDKMEKQSLSLNKHFVSGLPVMVRGVGFYDASHEPGTNHGDEHCNRYSWELHPVIDLDFLNGG
jgi:hypothetical protein